MNLSYILPTYNKLPYLKVTLSTLLASKKKDEEIVIIDGGSTDGTVEYLRELFERGDVDQFVSEPDRGIGHAINKGMLMAKGELLKTLCDDDVYYYDEIEKCKVFMLEHPEIDALGSNGMEWDKTEYHGEEDFMLWKNTPYHPFMLAETGMMLRRSSIPIFGLADISFVFWNGEFVIRLTAGKSRLAWYTGITYNHTFNPSSTSVTQSEVWRVESARLRYMYPNLYSKWRHHVPKPIRTFIRFFFPKKLMVKPGSIIEPTFLS